MEGMTRAVFLVVVGLLFMGGGHSEICKTKACRTISERMLTYMDPSTRPCDDFYRFACRRFENTAEIDSDQTQNSSFTQVHDELQEQLKTIVYEKPKPSDPLPYRNLRHLFSLCMDEQTIDARGIGQAVSRIRDAGGWPVLGDWDEENWNVLDTEIKLLNLSIGGENLFEVGISVDLKNTSRRMLAVDQASLGLSREFLVNGMDDPIVQAYYSYMVDIAVLYGADREAAGEQLRESLLFEIDLAKLTVPREQRRDFGRMYNPFDLQDLKTAISWLNWEKLLKGILPEDVALRENELILVIEVDFLKKLEGFLQKYPKRVIANYMMWNAARSMTGALTFAMRNRTQEFAEVVLGTKSQKPRWKQCIDVSGSLGIVLSSLYVKKYFDKTSKKVALDMTEKIRQEMYKEIKEVDWMDNQTRSRALYKVLQVKDYIGYPDELLDMSKIEQHYQGLVLDGDDYLAEIFKLKEWSHNYQYRQLRKPVNKTDWKEHSDVAVVNAFYNPLENSMKFPAGILQLPFFDARLPKYVNYGAIGFVMAHEITHGFDDQGSQFDFKGDLKQWWTDDSKRIFNEKKKCFIDQYSNFVDSITGLNLNGINNQGEIVADNGGFKLALRAYRRLNVDEPRLPGLSDFNQEQLFMLSMASMWCTKYRPQALKYLITTGVHPPPEFRVNGVLKNFPEFSKVFKCSPGDAMNPREKCAVW